MSVRIFVDESDDIRFEFTEEPAKQQIDLEEFNRHELWKWCMPGEFSFGPSGEADTLQPVSPQLRVSPPPADLAAKTNSIRMDIARLRRDIGVPPFFWNRK